MDTSDVVVAFQLTETGLKSDFRNFLNKHLVPDTENVFSGEVNQETLDEIKKEAGSVEYEDNNHQDSIVIYIHDTLGINKETF